VVTRGAVSFFKRAFTWKNEFENSDYCDYIDFCETRWMVLRCHYPGTTTTSEALKTGKPLWSSEDYSTDNEGTGAGCWARVSVTCISKASDAVQRFCNVAASLNDFLLRN
jgi:hypothetical protein